MDYRQMYEALFQEQCDAYEQMLYAITQISACDNELLSCSNCEEPDVNKVQELTYKKDYYIKKLDSFSLTIEKNKGRLADILYLYNDFRTHPLYLRMEKLQELTKEELQELINKEDKNNPSVISKLTQYKEKLETDIKIREIPMEKRKIFFIYPEK